CEERRSEGCDRQRQGPVGERGDRHLQRGQGAADYRPEQFREGVVGHVRLDRQEHRAAEGLGGRDRRGQYGHRHQPDDPGRVRGGRPVEYVKGVRLVTSVTRTWTAVQAVFNATMLINPIGLIVIAIVALIAIFVLAYKHVGWFRAAVDAAWAGIKVAIKATMDWIVGTLWPSLKRAWDAIAAGALWLWRNAILPAWNGIKTAISTVIGAVMAVVHGLVSAWNGLAAAG